MNPFSAYHANLPNLQTISNPRASLNLLDDEVETSEIRSGGQGSPTSQYTAKKSFTYQGGDPD